MDRPGMRRLLASAAPRIGRHASLHRSLNRCRRGAGDHGSLAGERISAVAGSFRKVHVGSPQQRGTVSAGSFV
jgi:hypothetical protein